MDRRSLNIASVGSAVATAVAVLFILAYALGWFGGGAEAPPPAATTPTPAPEAGGTTQ